MKLALAADHAGYPLKNHLVAFLSDRGHDVIDLGVDTDVTRVDYPDVAQRLSDAITGGQAERGILICGSGVGASIAANKVHGIYAAICHDAYSAAQGVEHDNMNVLCLGARVIGPALAESLAEAFTKAAFNTTTERYLRRFEKLKQMENDG